MKLWKREIGDPIRGLTLDRLASQLEAYNRGLLAQFAISAEAMEQRDDVLKNVISKRKKAVTRHGWEILTIDDSPEAEKHRHALETFYNNLTVTNALREDERGGLPLLIYQMMDAVGKGFAIHEITWRPLRDAQFQSAFRNPKSAMNLRALRGENDRYLTAELRSVPLWFFENTTGKLRFLPNNSAQTGIPLKPREWLITTGEALMIACSRSFLFKHQPLQAWLDYCQKYGAPGLRAVTTAARGTPEFDAMQTTLDQFMTDLAVVTNNAESIEVIDLKGSDKEPFSSLVERMDRVMIALWRGADLSTLSRAQGYGASLQQEESRILEFDDAALISTTLNTTLDPWVIQYLFGEGTTPLAYIKIQVTPKEGTAQDLAIDQFLLQHGAKLSLPKTLERYGRAPANDNEPALVAQASLPAGSDASRFGIENNLAHRPLPIAHSTPENTDSTHNSHNSYTSDLPNQEMKTENTIQSQRTVGTSASAASTSTSSLTNRDTTSTQTRDMKTEDHTPTDESISFPNTANTANATTGKFPLPGGEGQGEGVLQKSAIRNPQLANSFSLQPSTFNLLQPDMVQLSPYGTFPHTRGLQHLDRPAAETLVKNFNTFFAKLGRRFVGVPFYIGHPDIPGYDTTSIPTKKPTAGSQISSPTKKASTPK
jgi:hypothetical protein